MDSKIVQVALNGLENILRLGEQESKQNGVGVNPYCALIEEAYGKQAVESLQLWVFLMICPKWPPAFCTSTLPHSISFVFIIKTVYLKNIFK